MKAGADQAEKGWLRRNLRLEDALLFLALLLGVGIVGVLIFYVMLVYAPRQVADREGTAGTWAVRFLVFLVSLAIGQTVTGLIHPA